MKYLKRDPMLIISGELDRTFPWAVSNSALGFIKRFN